MLDLSNFTIKEAKKLEKSFGDSYYLFNSDQFSRNIDRFKISFEKFYSNIQLGYSYKTNYLPAVCKIAKEKGALAEVVSGLEYNLALKIGYDGEDIIFNGPVKTKEELFFAFKKNSIIHFDSYEEILVLKEYLNQNINAKVRCALRCNFDIGEETRSRFGFDIENNEALEVYQELFSLKGCEPIGIHCHFSTKNRSLESYKIRTKKLLEFALRVFNKNDLHYVDIGGGFFGELNDSNKHLFSCETPDFMEYGKCIGQLMQKEFSNQKVKLILEPGVALVANTMQFICKVISKKSINSTCIFTLSGGMHNVRPTGMGSDSNIHFETLSCNHNEFVENAVIGGYTCMETDVINSNFSGKLRVGDFILFHNMGAYNIVFKPPFIKESPPIIARSVDGSNAILYELVRNRETISDMFKSYIF